MKNIKYIIGIVFALPFFMSSCDNNDYKFGDIVAPSNVKISYKIKGVDADNPYGDGSGSVTFKVQADDAITYQLNYGDGTSVVEASGNTTKIFTLTGVNKYLVTATAIGTAGVGTSVTTEVEVYSSFSDEEAEKLMAGAGVGDSKTWYWAYSSDGYAGLGPQTADDGAEYWPAWWQATANDPTRTCMFSNTFVFSRTKDGITFMQTADHVFVPGAYGGVLGVDGDACYGTDIVPGITGVKKVSFAPSTTEAGTQGTFNEEPYRGTAFTIADNGMLGWWVGNSTYDIVSLTATEMIVRVTQPNSAFAWYQKFTTSNPATTESSEFKNLVWSDEFDTDGAPDATKWTYDLGAGGWGNAELQTYTKDAENVIVKDGVLKITAKADGKGGYTSARLKTQGLYSFKYGRVEIKAKLPAVQGTWPALWLLGDKFATDGWPNCGEIDIMEQTGADKENVLGTLHWFDTSSSSNASYGLNTAVANASTEFHVYSMEWTEKAIKISVDDVKFYEMANSDALPFNDKFFLIFNIAMGGTLGGAVATDFAQDIMEIDYVKVYQ